MHRVIFIFFFIATCLPGFGQGQDFKTLTSQLFFDIDLNKRDTALLSSLDLKPELVLKPQTGWTVYPPTDDNGNPIPYYTYLFFKHPYFHWSFADGTMTVLTGNDSKVVTGLVLSLSFNSKPGFDSTYKILKGLYNKYSAKSIKRNNMAWPFEVTKFLSKDNEFVILTKSQDDNKYYLNFSYNYQGYRW